ncbi:zinc finger MYND domain-containing protein 12 [Pempheris klunzingeri]|uniref:zinc finger MYND domain-containing protein 12 n=1 Tax=Pempheris klunzingeri TaxID=3127111 RepID=UPI00397FC316
MEAKPKSLGTSAMAIALAFPKGMDMSCELCPRRARLQCTKCRVTFYCDAEHQQADWVGIHGRICQLLVPIRTRTLPSVKQADHNEIQLKRAELIEICRVVAQSKLSERKHHEALLAAQFCLRSSIEVHGSNAAQTIDAYRLLADANMGLGNLTLVVELLSQAERAVLKNPECGHGVHHRLHRSLGRFYTTTGNLEAALFNFANDIYFASEEYGLYSTVTSGGYFLMADVFAKQGKMPIARSLYSDVAGVWHSYLTKLLQTHIQYLQKPDMRVEPSYDRAQRVEVDEILRTMLEFEQNYPRKDPAQVALVANCLAMLWFLGGDSLKALGFGSTAQQASQLIPNHNLAKHIQGLLQLVQSLQTEPRTCPAHLSALGDLLHQDICLAPR